ncbi:MAG TPA: alpha-ketoglutarate-dependent dioxygenase AlkB [Steroidobacteraceae bacterium]
MPPANPPPTADGQRLDLPDADVRLWRAAWAPAAADRLCRDLLAEIDWRQEEVLIFGQRRLVPRLVAWHGDPGTAYTYSGTVHEPLPWTPALAGIKARVESLTCHTFNSVLLNRYRGGRDGMGWHADDEPELGREPAIASVSFGAPRRFLLKHRRLRAARQELLLGHGDLLLMAGATQHHYVHAVPKTAREVGERINLTFRRVTVAA